MMRSFRALSVAALLPLVACAVPGCAPESGSGEPKLGESAEELTLAERMTRYAKMRTAATNRGILGRGYLLAGIAMAETNLCHCWSEATWACKGPSSADCGGGPVIAGASDGPCSAQQGGLGMFQFDAGTFTDTLAKYGQDVLLIEGNTSHAIDYAINMVKISAYTTNAETDAKAKAWINNFDIGNGTLRDQWIKTVTHYYNGCAPSYSCWASRYKHYNDSLSSVLGEADLAFWAAGGAPAYKGTFAAQSFPTASQSFDLFPTEVKAGYIDLKNEGTKPWNVGEVFLGTTQPRDVASPLAAPDWVKPSRPTTVDKDTAPGAVGRFSFSVKAPTKPGAYPQFFSLVREGVAWFSDPDQGGPPDDLLEVKVTVKPSTCPAGVGATFICQGTDREKCDLATGVITKEACTNGCTMKTGGAECNPAGQGGAAGASGSAGASGGAGSGGKSGAAGGGAAGASVGGKGGAGGASSAGGKGGGGGAAGAVDAGVAGVAGSAGTGTTVVNDDNTEKDAGGCACRASAPSRPVGGWCVLGLGLAAVANRRGRRRI